MSAHAQTPVMKATRKGVSIRYVAASARRRAPLFEKYSGRVGEAANYEVVRSTRRLGSPRQTGIMFWI